MRATVNDNIQFLGQMRGQNRSNTDKGKGEPKTSETGNMFFTRAEFKYTNNNFTASAGRVYMELGQGLIWAERADGFLLSYDFGRAKLTAGYADLAALVSGSSVNTFVANLGVKVTDRINLTAAYLDAINPQDYYSDDWYNPSARYDFKQWAVGGNAKIGGNFKVIAEYVRNSDAPADGDKNGFWSKLQWREINTRKPGTFATYVEYMRFGNWAIDSSNWGHILNVAGGNGIGLDGAKGWGLGFEYVPAKNVSMDVAYYDMKPTKNNSGFDKYKKSYMVTTHFYF